MAFFELDKMSTNVAVIYQENNRLEKENAKLKEQLAAMTYEMNHYKKICKQLQSKDEEE